MSVHQFSATTINGEKKLLAEYKGKVLLIVNTASNCGFTPQYEGLQNLYKTYKEEGFEILGFPSNQFMNQEPGTEEEIQDFCQINYGVSFPMFRKTDVKGKSAHPLFKHLTTEAPGALTKQIKWNFTKFLIDRDGNVIARYSPQTKPESIEKDIEKALAT
ncbi:glutathione peroxidase [Sediminibacillus massiliensis]|uniref:glutathione peroxidase n=1 Tax=Sediminibacillus massiliensis TaxID=1926277 RepID=UPI0009887F4E|nr:glutathione peroxidase [Sediminibacillus massiliensis]